MEFFFNELSIHNQFVTHQDFQTAVNLFRAYRETVKNAGFKFYIHREILQRPVLGTQFRKCIQACLEKQQAKTLMNWLNKAGSFLPDESYADITDQFTCHLHQNQGGGTMDITGSAMAECAFRSIVNGDAALISLNNSIFVWSPIKVEIGESTETIFENYYSHPNLAQRIAGLRPAITSWTILMDRINQLPNVSIEAYVLDRLKSNTFAQNVAESLDKCANILSAMATAPTLDQFNELFTKHATGEKARFSDSSDSEKTDFEGALSFEVDGIKRLCPYHGKVKIQQYRVHLADRPSFGNPVRIVYIGPKLTKK